MLRMTTSTLEDGNIFLRMSGIDNPATHRTNTEDMNSQHQSSENLKSHKTI